MSLFQQIEAFLGFAGGVNQEPIAMWATAVAALLAWATMLKVLSNITKGGDKW
jgi:hypothetical protein